MNLWKMLNMWASHWTALNDNSDYALSDAQIVYHKAMVNEHGKRIMDKFPKTLTIPLPAYSASVIQDAIEWVNDKYPTIDTSVITYAVDNNGESVIINTMPSIALYQVIWRLHFIAESNELDSKWEEVIYNRTNDKYYLCYMTIIAHLKLIEAN